MGIRIKNSYEIKITKIIIFINIYYYFILYFLNYSNIYNYLLLLLLLLFFFFFFKNLILNLKKIYIYIFFYI